MATRNKLIPARHVFDDPHWQRCLEDFLTHIYQLGQSTASHKNYRNILQRFFADPARTPASYSKQDVERFLAQPLGRKTSVSPKTRNVRRSAIKSFYEYALDYSYSLPDAQEPLDIFTGKVPTRGVRPSKIMRAERGMSAEEIRRFFAVIPADSIAGMRDKALFLAYFWTGKRKREIAELRWQDIQATAFGGRSGWKIAFVGKGKAGEVAYAELPRDAKEAIDRYLFAAGRSQRIAPKDYVFTQANRHVTRQGDEPLGDAWILQLMKKYLALAGLDTRHCIHSFRHSAAQLRREKGLSIEEIQEFLGHAHAYTTWIYLESSTSHEDAGAQLLAAQFGGM